MTNNLTARAARWSAEHRWLALSAWIVFVLGAFVVGTIAGTKQLSDAQSASGQSAVAEQILTNAGFPQSSGESVLVQSSTLRASDPAFRAVVADVAAKLRTLPNVTQVLAPTARASAGLVSRDGHSALVNFNIPGNSNTAQNRVSPILAQVAALQRAHPAYTVAEFGEASSNYEVNNTYNAGFARAEKISIPVTLLIMVVAFGALVAAAVPVALAFSAVLGALGISALLSHLVPATDTTATVILLVGMAVGVDYSLFYLRRQLEERRNGRTPRNALIAAAATSGRAILISGATVVTAMAGMLLAGNKVFVSIGVGTMVVVCVTVIGSLSILPGILALLGDRVNAGRVPWLGRHRGQGRIWPAIISRVLRRPLVAATAATVLLVLLALPAFGMQTTLLSFTDLPHSLPIVRTYDQIQRAFPGSQVPADVVVKAPSVHAPAVRQAVAALESQALATRQFSEPFQVLVNSRGTVAQVLLPMVGNGTDAASGAALATLRDHLIPATLGHVTGAQVAVTGQTAGTVDFNNQLRQRAPIVFAFVLGLAFLLLLVSFRSLVVPIKAIVLNLLSVGAAYGILVAVFQRGHGSGLLGVQGTHPIVSWLPLFLFVILFGLSMDYHVFILSRIRELVDRGRSTRVAVEEGITATAGTVTAAAVVMVAVFSIFGTLDTIDLKEAGVGLAVAILLDATVIRGVLLPSAMVMLDDWNWYLPRWLDRILPGGRDAVPADERLPEVELV